MVSGGIHATARQSLNFVKKGLEIIMGIKIFLLGMLVIGITFIGCDSGTTNGNRNEETLPILFTIEEGTHIGRGTITISATEAAAGTTINVSAISGTDYTFVGLTVTPTLTTVSTGSGNNRSFTMPANPIAITATFVKDYGNGNGNGNVNVVGDSGGNAMLWRNGVPQNLGTGMAHSVFVSGDNVYVAGNSGGNAMLWRNGVAQNLGPGEARSVFVSGNNVYLAGMTAQSGGDAMLWRSGIAKNLQKEGSGSSAWSVFVSGNDVYVAGRLGFWQQPVIWKNGEILQNLGTTGTSVSVFVSDNNVYVAGTDASWGNPTLWTNGTPQNLGMAGGRGNAHSAFVSGSDVYVAGSIEPTSSFDNVAMLWKNGVSQKLELESDAISVALSVFVFDNDVYVAGFSGVYATVWVNGEIQTLGQGRAMSVFVAQGK